MKVPLLWMSLEACLTVQQLVRNSPGLGSVSSGHLMVAGWRWSGSCVDPECFSCSPDINQQDERVTKCRAVFLSSEDGRLVT